MLRTVIIVWSFCFVLGLQKNSDKNRNLLTEQCCQLKDFINLYFTIVGNDIELKKTLTVKVLPLSLYPKALNIIIQNIVAVKTGRPIAEYPADSTVENIYLKYLAQ